MDFSHIEETDRSWDEANTEARAKWLTPERVAELLGVTVDQVIAVCQSGEMDSQWNEFKDDRRQYFVYCLEVDRYKRSGPRKRMAFTEVMSLLDEGRPVRRASWNREYIAYNMYETLSLWWYYNGPDPGWWFGDPYTEGEEWYPSKEDEDAVDWVEHEIVMNRK